MSAPKSSDSNETQPGPPEFRRDADTADLTAALKTYTPTGKLDEY